MYLGNYFGICSTDFPRYNSDLLLDISVIVLGTIYSYCMFFINPNILEWLSIGSAAIRVQTDQH
jgi:hypothetical protein